MTLLPLKKLTLDKPLYITGKFDFIWGKKRAS